MLISKLVFKKIWTIYIIIKFKDHYEVRCPSTAPVTPGLKILVLPISATKIHRETLPNVTVMGTSLLTWPSSGEFKAPDKLS